MTVNGAEMNHDVLLVRRRNVNELVDEFFFFGFFNECSCCWGFSSHLGRCSISRRSSKMFFFFFRMKVVSFTLTFFIKNEHTYIIMILANLKSFFKGKRTFWM